MVSQSTEQSRYPHQSRKSPGDAARITGKLFRIEFRFSVDGRQSQHLFVSGDIKVDSSTHKPFRIRCKAIPAVDL